MRFSVPPQVRDELGRLVTRWRSLTLDQAAARLPQVRASVVTLAALVGPDQVPEVGPDVVMDQLTVVAQDASNSGHGARVHTELVALRRRL